MGHKFVRVQIVASSESRQNAAYNKVFRLLPSTETSLTEFEPEDGEGNEYIVELNPQPDHIVSQMNDIPFVTAELVEIPDEIQAILDTFEDETYPECERIEKEMGVHGWAMDWGLDAQPYNLRKMNYIVNRDVIHLTIAGYTADVDFGGGLCWTHPNTKITIWATPNWDDNVGTIPFGYDIDGDGENHLITLEISDGTHKDQQLAMYINMVTAVSYITNVHAYNLAVSK